MRLIFYILIMLILVFGSLVGFFWYNVWGLGKQTKTSSQDEIQALMNDVSGLIILPEDEVPTIVTVTNLEQLKNYSFFVKAKVGDKVLIYANAKKAILYDPVAKKIVEIAPINIPEK